MRLYSHQKETIKKLASGSILVGGVGSGKSITSLAYFFNYICLGDYEKNSSPLCPVNLYIITTARKRDTLEWDEECARFGLSRDERISRCGIKVVIDSWNNIKKYETVENSFFIFDEQRVVGSGAWVRTFLKITKKNKWILLSATPGDTWSDYIPVFIANGFYKNRTAFLRRHAIFDRFAKYPKIIRYVDTDVLEYYRDKILVKMQYSTKCTRITTDIYVDFDKELYNLAFKKRWNPYLDEPIMDAGALCHILRKIVNSDKDRLSKLHDISLKQNKVIVFYNLNSELDNLRNIKEDFPDLSDYDIAEWNGHKHEPIPSSDKWLYFVQYAAGAEGWNCIDTNVIVFYSLNYSYKIMQQASGRIDRINTNFNNLYYYRFVSESEIDKAILNTLKKKKTFNEKAFGDILMRT